MVVLEKRLPRTVPQAIFEDYLDFNSPWISLNKLLVSHSLLAASQAFAKKL